MNFFRRFPRTTCRALGALAATSTLVSIAGAGVPSTEPAPLDILTCEKRVPPIGRTAAEQAAAASAACIRVRTYKNLIEDEKLARLLREHPEILHGELPGRSTIFVNRCETDGCPGLPGSLRTNPENVGHQYLLEELFPAAADRDTLKKQIQEARSLHGAMLESASYLESTIGSLEAAYGK